MERRFVVPDLPGLIPATSYWLFLPIGHNVACWNKLQVLPKNGIKHEILDVTLLLTVQSARS